MIGLIVLGVIALYLLVAGGVVFGAYRIATGLGLPPPRAWRAAGIAGLVMYLLPFWDWLPTVAAHRYYCWKDSGLTIYKTLDQWKAENPGVAETLTWKRIPDRADSQFDSLTGEQMYVLNQRFNWQVRRRKLWFLGVRLVDNRLIDRKTREVLARHADVVTGYGNPMTSNDWRAEKGWLDQGPCDGLERPSLRKFEDLANAAKKMGVLQ